MTRQRSYSEKPALLHGSFFGYSLRQNWPTLLLLAIAYFFIANVPLMLTLASQMYNFDYYTKVHEFSAAEYYKNLDSMLGNIGNVYTTLTALLASLLGLISFKYELKKVDCGFYHSIPLRRETMYVNETLKNTLFFLIAIGVNYAVSMGVLLSKVPLRFDDGMILFRFVMASLLIYAVMYFVTVFASMFASTMGGRIAATITVFFLPIGVYFTCLFPASLANNFGEVGANFEKICRLICFPVRIGFLGDDMFFSGDMFSIIESALYAVVAVAAFVLGLVLFKHKPVETSGTPIARKLPNIVVKYFFVTISATGLGALLYFILDSWLIFGLVSGAFLSFIFVNALLNKSFRAMFKGFKWFIVFAVVFALVFVGFLFDPLNLDEYIPSAGITEAVTVDFGSDEAITFTDKDDIAALRTAMLGVFEKANHTNENTDYHYTSVIEAYDIPSAVLEGMTTEDKAIEITDYENYSRVDYTVYTVFGLAVKKNAYLPTAMFDGLAKAIKESKTVTAKSEREALIPEGDNFGYIYLNMFGFGKNVDLDADDIKTLRSTDAAGLFDVYVGRLGVSVKTDDYFYDTTKYTRIPADEKVINILLDNVMYEFKKDYEYMNDEYVEKYGVEMAERMKIVDAKTPFDSFILSFVESVKVANVTTGKSATFTELGEIKAVLLSVDPNACYGTASILTNHDDRYTVEVVCREGSLHYGVYGYIAMFFDGATPEFVVNTVK